MTHYCTFYCCPICHTNLLAHEEVCAGPIEVIQLTLTERELFAITRKAARILAEALVESAEMCDKLLEEGLDQ